MSKNTTGKAKKLNDKLKNYSQLVSQSTVILKYVNTWATENQANKRVIHSKVYEQS